MAENGENQNQEAPNQQQENNERKYICNACKNHSTNDLSKALIHSSNHKKNYSFACAKCAWVFNDYKIYESHFLGEHVAKHHRNHGKNHQPKADPPIIVQEEQMIVDAIHQKKRAVLEPAMAGRDMIGGAITCCGKTIAFGIPILDKTIRNRAPGRQMLFPSCLVLAPTRELTRQVQIEFEDTAPNLSSVCLYGGMPIMNQFRQLEYGVDIAIGTPGRIIDLVERGSLILSEVKFVVLDEADQMLAVGFQEDVEWILNYLPKQRPSVSRRMLAVGFQEDVLDVTNVAHVINLDLPKLWFPLYYVLRRGQNADSSADIQSTVQSLEEFIQTSIGEFKKRRLQLFFAFHGYISSGIRLKSDSSAFLMFRLKILYNIFGYHVQSLTVVLVHIKANKGNIVGDLKQLLKLSQWERPESYLLIETSKRTCQKLRKLIWKFNALVRVQARVRARRVRMSMEGPDVHEPWITGMEEYLRGMSNQELNGILVDSHVLDDHETIEILEDK